MAIDGECGCGGQDCPVCNPGESAEDLDLGDVGAGGDMVLEDTPDEGDDSEMM